MAYKKYITYKAKKLMKTEACLIEDESNKGVLTGMKKYCESVNKEIDDRFNDKSIEIMLFASSFETFPSMSGPQDKEVINFLQQFSHSQCRRYTCGFEIFCIFRKVTSKNCLSREIIQYWINRILKKARTGMIPETHCVIVSVGGPEVPAEEFLEWLQIYRPWKNIGE